MENKKSVDSVSITDRLQIPCGPKDPILKVDGNVEKITWDSDGTLVWEAPLGDRVYFSFPLPGEMEFSDYGLAKFDLKIEGGQVDVMAFVEEPGKKHRLYRPIDIGIPRKGWNTIYLDLRQPEIIRESYYEADSPRLTFNLWSVKGGYSDEEPTRRISIRNVRLVRRHLDVHWNGRDYTSRTEPGGELVFEYPIVVTNRDENSRNISAHIRRFQGRYGSASISPEKADIATGDSARFTAVLRLSTDEVNMLPVLACSWFSPVFSVDGIPDSEEIILRSSDEIALPIIIMPKHRKNPVILFDSDELQEIRERYRTTDWGKKAGDRYISRAESFIKRDLTIPDGPGWASAYYYCQEHRSGLSYEGPGKHKCRKGGEYLNVDFMKVDLDRDYRTGQHANVIGPLTTVAIAYALTGDERFSKAALKVLHQYKKKYFTWDWLDLDASTETIDKGRIQFAKYMESMYMLYLTEAYDIIRGCGGISEKEAHDLEWNLLIPISVEMTDYRMGMIHRQNAITKNALATGLACGHAPLVAFAVSGPANTFMIRRCGATSDGIAHGHGYANITRRQFDCAGMLYRMGVNTYDHMLKRLLWNSLWWSVPFNPGRFGGEFLHASKHYPDPEFRILASRDLINGEATPAEGVKVEFGTPPSVNFHNSGLSILRRPWEDGTIDAEFRWGMTDMRGSFSMMSLALYFGGYKAQNYPGHFSWGSTDLHHKWQIQSASHSTIVVDMKNQSGMFDYVKDHYQPHASKQLFYEVGKNASATVVYNDGMYPGVKIWRAVSVLDGAFLVIDMIRSDTEHTYDRWFHGVPDKSNGLEGIHLDMKKRTEPLGDSSKYGHVRNYSSGAGGYEMVKNFHSAATSSDFGCDWKIPGNDLNLAVRVLNTEPMEVIHGFEWSRQYTTQDEKEFLLMRRKAQNADFIVLFEPNRGESKLSDLERFTVRGENGGTVKGALGVRATLNGKKYEVILNPDEVPVKTVKGSTRKVFSIETMK